MYGRECVCVVYVYMHLAVLPESCNEIDITSRSRTVAGLPARAVGSGASPDASRVEILSRTVQSPSLKGYTGQCNSATVPIKFCTSKLRRILNGFWALQGTLLGRFLDRFRNIFRISVFDHFLDTFFIIFGSILASFFDHFLMFFRTGRICENCAPA